MRNEEFKETTRRRIIELIDEFCGSERDRKQQAFADMCGVSKFSISQYVNGTNSPGNITAAKIAKKCHVNPLWVMGFDVAKHEKLITAAGDSKQTQYYVNEETAQIAQAIFDNHGLYALFDAAQDCKPEDIKMAEDLLRRLKGTNPDG